MSELYHWGMRRLFAAIVLVRGVCYGDPVNLFFTALPSVQQNYSYQNGPGSTGVTYNGWSIATITGIPLQDLICDDYSDTTYMPSSSNLLYDYSTLTGPDALEYARFPGLETYETAAVLLSEFTATANPTDNTVTDYQYALWNLFEPDVTINGKQQTFISDAQGLVLANSPQATSTYAGLAIYTPTQDYASNQEFLAWQAAPEPDLAPMLMLIGATLLVARSWGRRK